VRCVEDVPAAQPRHPAEAGALALYPGSFNPPSRMHVDVARRVSALPGIDAVWLDMTSHVGEKQHVQQVLADRVRMAEIAVAGLERVGVVQLMSEMGDAGQTGAYFDTLERLTGGAPLAWVMGSDVVLGMRWWTSKARELMLRCAQVVVVRREHSEHEVVAALEAVLQSSREQLLAERRLTITVLAADPELETVSSSKIRRYLVALLQSVRGATAAAPRTARARALMRRPPPTGSLAHCAAVPGAARGAAIRRRAPAAAALLREHRAQRPSSVTLVGRLEHHCQPEASAPGSRVRGPCHSPLGGV
jgi:nicotinic acid mononucleotide adenylyltransferase